MGSQSRALVFCCGLMATLLGVAPAAPAATQKAYPDQPLHLVIPYPPGATTDLVGRLVADKLRGTLHQPVIVENRGGASGEIGSAHVAHSAPDGYTIVLGTDATHASNYFMTKNPPYNPITDFTPITMAVKNIVVLVANPAFPPNTLPELVTYVKQHPGKVSFGSSGNGSPHHLAGVLFNELAGTDMMHVPYKGGGPAAVDVLGGQIPLIFSSLATVDSYIKSKKLKVLGVTEKSRYEGLPQVPAIDEALPGFEISSWLGFFGPAGLPKPIVQTLNTAIVAALRTPQVRDKLSSMGLLVVADKPEDFARLQKATFDKAGKLIKASGLVPR
ncbi:Bug family tripartite tricarboxylate transporter substrate binding protein [Candidimonas nitroreducens]|uniref:ABC transporter substrate-binding protein n=1 Tax=Candidimonas nitroreducens TaxID=683354 RepID=A0A225M270_9BURK|nr:tripartite tricarboxylate transporter substrate binding protein [Candidimonas nitroreducens]OWT55216.1 ABC transporter substrate-binding protein [Candidimonas nitroreducens]